MNLATIDGNEIIIIKELHTEQEAKLLEIINSVSNFRNVYMALEPVTSTLSSALELINKYQCLELPYVAFQAGITESIQNYLSCFRSYIDTFAHTLSKYYGKDSQIFKQFEIEKAAAFDSNESYRFITALRNFVQHRAFPDCSINVVNGNPRQITITISKQCLIEDKKFKSSSIPIKYNQIDNIPIIEDYKIVLGCLSMIHHKILMMAKDLTLLEEFFEVKRDFISYASGLCLNESLTKADANIDIKIQSFDFSIVEELLESLEEEERFINDQFVGS